MSVPSEYHESGSGPVVNHGCFCGYRISASRGTIWLLLVYPEKILIRIRGHFRIPTPAISEGHRGSQFSFNECFFRFKAQRKGHTPSKVTQLCLEMPFNPPQATSNRCFRMGICFIIRPGVCVSFILFSHTLYLSLSFSLRRCLLPSLILPFIHIIHLHAMLFPSLMVLLIIACFIVCVQTGKFSPSFSCP